MALMKKQKKRSSSTPVSHLLAQKRLGQTGIGFRAKGGCYEIQ